MKRTALLLSLLLLVPFFATDRGSARPRLHGSFKAVVAATDQSLWDVSVPSAKRIVICGVDGTLVTSEDGGETWQDHQVREGVSLHRMRWSDSRRGIFLGRRHGKNLVLLTSDGGESVREGELEFPFPVHDLAFLDGGRGWLVGGSEEEKDGAWRLSDDGGTTWKERDSVAFRYPARVLYGIAAFGEKDLWAVGSHVEVALVGDAAKSFLYRKKKGSVLHSDDWGNSWFVQDAGNPEDVRLRAVDFVSRKIGWVVGDKGFAARTADGGASWKVLDTGVTTTLTALDAVSGKVAFAVGEGGVAVGTIDEGKTFSVLPTGTKKDLRAVAFYDENTGWAVGKTGTVLKFRRGW